MAQKYVFFSGLFFQYVREILIVFNATASPRAFFHSSQKW